MKKNSQTHISETKEKLVTILQNLAGDGALQIEFEEEVKNNFFAWNQNLVSGSGDKKKVVLPEVNLAEPDNHELIEQFRAVSDMALCYILFHDKKLNDDKNYTEEEWKFFNEFEKIRVISLVKNLFRGVVKNILERLRSDFSERSEGDDTNLSLIFLKEIFPDTKNLTADYDKNLSKNIKKEVKSLRQSIYNQALFFQHVERILELLKKEKEDNCHEKKEKKSRKIKDKIPQDLTSSNQENSEQKTDSDFLNDEKRDVVGKDSKQQNESKLSEIENDENGTDVRLGSDKTAQSDDTIQFKNPYKVFTNKFDEIVFPQKLIPKNELELLRLQLDLKFTKLQTISKKISLKLKKKLLSKRNFLTEYDSSLGILNRKKLSRLVIDPFLEDIWVNVREYEYHDTAITILLDNSGSMRGNPIVMTAMACEIISDILEKFSIKTEIIGFTTADWRGGRAKKLWESLGKEKNPGRLNELRHIIYKHFKQRFKRSRVNLGLMLKEGILKENIDGEALLFARSRLMQQSEKRKILLVISDGTPVDDSTALANDSDILSDHLRHVIHKIESSSTKSLSKQSRIEVVGIGIGHTTDEFYKNSITIKNLDELGNAMIEKITDLL